MEGVRLAGMQGGEVNRLDYLNGVQQSLQNSEIDAAESRLKRAVILPFWDDQQSIDVYFRQQIAPDLRQVGDSQMVGEISIAVGAYADFIAHNDASALGMAKTRLKQLLDSSDATEEVASVAAGMYSAILVQHPTPQQ